MVQTVPHNSAINNNNPGEVQGEAADLTENSFVQNN